MAFKFDDIKDWTYGTVKEVKEGESKIVLETGEGALFSTPVNGYYLLVWPAGKLPLIKPAAGVGERVEAFRIEVGGLTGDTFKWTSRKQLGTEERSIQVGDQVMAPLSAETILKIQEAIEREVVSKAEAPLEITGGNEVKIKSESIQSAQVKEHGLTVDRLKEGEITNAYIKAAAGIEESKISLPNVVHLTGTETITGKKFFSPEAWLEESVVTGKEGLPAIFIFPSAGQTTSHTGTATGGGGGSFSVKAGPGGTATAAKTNAKGGAGGEGEVLGGQGGSAEAASGVLNEGGKGGRGRVAGGIGATASGSGTGKRLGGTGGEGLIQGGTGGFAQEGSESIGGTGGAGRVLGGEGGPGETELGGGGNAEVIGGPGRHEGVKATKIGPGGKAIIEGGKPGSVPAWKARIWIPGETVEKSGHLYKCILETPESGSEPPEAGHWKDEGEVAKAGSVEIIGGAGTTENLSAAIIFKTGKSSLTRMEINAEGLTTTKNGLTVEGRLTVPYNSTNSGVFAFFTGG